MLKRIFQQKEMNITKSGRPALILIDIQKGFENIEYWGGQRNNPDAELRASELLKTWRTHHLPIFHIRHCSSIPTSLLHETNAGNEFKDVVAPAEGEPITTRMAGNLGYETFLVADATATFNKKGLDGQNYSAGLIHETALASLNKEFATIVTTDFIKQRI